MKWMLSKTDYTQGDSIREKNTKVSKNQTLK